MPAMVALLRAVNVGGRNGLPMAALRDIASSCGLDDVRTYIQSGNLVFSSPDSTPSRVEQQLEKAIGEATGSSPEVLVRTREELADVVAGNPFLARGEDPAHLHVVFTRGPASVDLADPGAYRPEEAAPAGRHIYLLLPNGIGRSRLAAALSRRPGSAGTVRNWRTVAKLAEMAAELE